MTYEELLQIHAGIFENLSEYALVKNVVASNSEFRIIYKPTMGFVLIEEYADDIKMLMMERGVQIADSEDEIQPIILAPSHVIWDEEKQEWKKVTAAEVAKIAEERYKKKKDK